MSCVNLPVKYSTLVSCICGLCQVCTTKQLSDVTTIGFRSYVDPAVWSVHV